MPALEEGYPVDALSCPDTFLSSELSSASGAGVGVGSPESSVSSPDLIPVSITCMYTWISQDPPTLHGFLNQLPNFYIH